MERARRTSGLGSVGPAFAALPLARYGRMGGPAKSGQ